MAFSKSKGLVSIATGYSGGNYEYTKIDQFIAADNLSITADRAQDLDSYVNANGYLKRNVLKHMRDGISFSTAYMEYGKHEKFMSILRTGEKQPGCTASPEKKIRIRYFNEWENDYSTGFFMFRMLNTNTVEHIKDFLPIYRQHMNLSSISEVIKCLI